MLSSIGGDGTPTLPPARTTKSEILSNGPKDRPEVIKAPTANSAPSNPKRKAEDELLKSNYKASKDSKASGPSNGIAVSDKPRLQANAKTPTAASSSKSNFPYRGTNVTTPASATPSAPTAQIPKAAPKKGSYAEIMARANAAQTVSSAVGIIKHKPKEKISEKKELLRAKKGLSKKGKVGSRPAQRGGSPHSKSSSPAPGLPLSKKPSNKKIPQPTYKGTAKPAPAYRGTAKPVSSTTSSRNPPSSARPSASKSHRDRSDGSNNDTTNSEGLDEEDEVDYSSSASDMEAGFSDMMEEEQIAIKVAKKEDEEEARKEEEHKREKEERKRTLERLAKKAPKKIY